ncbi:MAG: flagellar motor switch protein FliN [Leptospiraceae bacterium]|nr:flagellar motor switch protein FliN [Leptospiraceae bacterium]MDW7975098.1 flagellar motor switch protein FliN [Leptospiraceae bacterium]
MVDAGMSQEEIDALLNNVELLETGESTFQTTTTTQKGVDLSPLERDRIADEILKGLSKGLSGLQIVLNANVLITEPYAEVRTRKEVQKDLKGSNVVFIIKVSGGVNGEAYLIFPLKEAHKIVNIIMGGNGDEDLSTPLDAAEMATIKDAFNPIIYSLISYFSARTGETFSLLGIQVVNGNEFVSDLSEEYLIRIQYNFEISGYFSTRLLLIFPFSMARSVLSLLQKKAKVETTLEETKEEEPTIPVKDVEFPAISTTTQGLTSPNIELLLDVQMTVTVELGRTKKYIKEILEMGEGTVIELDKQAGEHVDVLVNGKLIARGEVVIIDENFGVRIAEIISTKEKLGLRR